MIFGHRNLYSLLYKNIDNPFLVIIMVGVYIINILKLTVME